MTTLTPVFRRTFVLWLSWLWPILALISTIFTFYLKTVVCAPVYQKLEILSDLPVNFSGITFGILCVLIVSRQPRNRIGWLCGAIAALSTPFLGPSRVFLDCAGSGLITLPGFSYLAWLTTFSGLAVSLQFLLLPLWFPDGRFLSAGWRRFALVVYGLLVLTSLLWAVWPGKLLSYEAQTGNVLDNPFGLPFQPSPGLARLVQAFIAITLLGGILIANFSLFARWRRADSQTRQQLKVVAFFLVTVGSVFMLFELTNQLFYPDLANLWDGWLYIYMALLVLLWVGLPTAIGVAVLRYRLYNIDFLIRRTLVYSLLTAVLGLVYFGLITLLQNLFHAMSGEQPEIVIVITTLVIAALFSPLRLGLQNAIDRRFYRRKYDAEQALASFSALAREEVDLEEIRARLLEVVQETVQPEHASLWLKPAADGRTEFDSRPRSAEEAE
jgi:hypothetical protein